MKQPQLMERADKLNGIFLCLPEEDGSNRAWDMLGFYWWILLSHRTMIPAPQTKPSPALCGLISKLPSNPGCHGKKATGCMPLATSGLLPPVYNSLKESINFVIQDKGHITGWSLSKSGLDTN
jgi:hypothetical protein